MTARILLGTSGWNYDEWVGPVYRSREEPRLRRYAMFFDTVEIDSTFYSYPREEVVKALIKNVQEGFVFSAKAPQEVTHRRFLDIKAGAHHAMERFTKLMKPLNDNGMLGCILLQLPPSMRYNPEKLETFINEIDREFKYAVEFRHKSWIREETFQILRRHNIAYTIVDEPLLPPIIEITADTAYIRWHGRGAEPWYNYLYKRHELEDWTPRIRKIAEKTKVVYGYFNNHFHGYAVYNCIQVLEMLGLAEEKHRKLQTQVENFLLMSKKINQQEEEETDEFTRLLENLTDTGRIIRASEIPKDQIEITRSGDNVLEARVKEYHVVIDLGKRVVIHDCADWKRMGKSKKLCKHLIKLLQTIPRTDAIYLLHDIRDNLHIWRFDTNKD